MIATITKIDKQDSVQINIVVTYSDKSIDFLKETVFTLPEEKYASLNQASLEDMIRSEGKRYTLLIDKKDELSSLVGTEITI